MNWRVRSRKARPSLSRNGRPVFDLVPHNAQRSINWDAGEKFLQERGVTKLFSYVAPDFDEPLPADILLRPLPAAKPRPK
jgi:antitoxin (DNA-binding transcriptional repressor) of toxin-antitoxin stability system